MNQLPKIKQTLLRVARQVRRNFFPAKPNPDWEAIIQNEPAKWQSYRAAAQHGPKVLIATSAGGHQAATPIEGLLAVALTLRGANVHFLLCDEFLPACMQATSREFANTATFVKQGPKHMCKSCWQAGNNAYQPLQLPIHRYSQYVSPAKMQVAHELAASIPFHEIAQYSLDGVAVGEHGLAGALRYFAKGTLDDEPQGEAVLRRYLQGAILSTFAIQQLLTQEQFSVACFNHGIYVPQGLIGEVCRQRNIEVVNWFTAYRKQCFIFSHHDTYHHTLMNEPTSVWENLEWTPAIEQKTMDYLRSRWDGKRDWISFTGKPQEELAEIKKELEIDFDKPTIGLLTNVIWDAQLHYPANAFPNMIEWLRGTIAYFTKRPDLQLLIRVHPAEIRGAIPSRQPVIAEIAKDFPKLPPNVYIISPESQISTYAAMLQCDSVIIYGTKTGVELSSLSVPVIVAGEAWIRNKGITLDARTADKYYQILDRLPLDYRLDEATTRRARQYAYHFFFRRMIPLECVEPSQGWPPYQVRISSFDDLIPGKLAGLDTVCDGILKGTNFVFDESTAVRAGSIG